MSGDGYTHAEHDRRIANLVRLGKVAEVDAASGRARVQLDAGWTSDLLPWFERSSNGFRTWSAPRVGEQVCLLSMSGETGAGVILRGLYNGEAPAPETDPDVTVLGLWDDGASDRYDQAAHVRTLAIPAGGKLVVTVGATTLTIQDGQAVLEGATIALGGEGGPAVARVGDQVHVGSQVGTIVSGSAKVSAS